MSRLPTFDLVVATVDRTDPLGALLDSVEAQQGADVRVLLVDQNEDDRLTPVLAGRDALRMTHVRMPGRGLSRARNLALGRLEGDVVAFPDDDCVYPADLLGRVARLLGGRPELDGVVGRTADPHGRAPSRRFSPRSGPLARETVWYAGNSASMFLRRTLVERVGAFDETLGAGAGTPWTQGEETDYLIRALDAGARVEYDPELVVLHEELPRTPRAERAVAAGSGEAVGYLLGRHGYPALTVARMLVRPAGGAAAALLSRDGARARAQLATLGGRVRGYRAGRRR